MRGFWRDVRFTVRMLVKNVGFTVIAALTLAVGIGAATAIFSVVDAIILRPLPYPQPDRLVQVYSQFPGMHYDRFWLSPPEFFDLRKEDQSFESLGGYSIAGTSLLGGAQPVHTVTAYTTAGLLPTMGVQPMLGRFFTPEEDVPGDARAVVLSYELWRSNFGADPSIVGKQVRADAIAATVVGVMPKGFDFPGPGIELWMPLCLDPASTRRGNHSVSVIGRMKDGVSFPQASAELAGLVHAWDVGGTAMHHLDPTTHPLVMRELQGEIVGPVSWMLWLLQGAVLLVLLIACANVSSLLLARAEARGREIAIRTALGAGRGRLVRMFLTESLILGGLGGGLGLLLAMWGVDAMGAIIPTGAPRVAEIRMDLGVLFFAIGCTLLTSVIFGLAPFVHTADGGLDRTLRDGGQRATGSGARHRFRRGLVIAETALAVVLVIGCGLTVRSFGKLAAVDVGFNPDGLLTLQLEIPEKTYTTKEALAAYWMTLTERLDAVPGVTSATVMRGLPPNRPVNANDIAFVGKPPPGKNDAQWNVDYWQIVGPDYFKTMGIRLVDGRVFDERDTRQAPHVVLVNEQFARRFFPGENAIGKGVYPRGDRGDPPETIVGVVADVKQQGVEAQAGTEIYFLVDQWAALDRPPVLMNVVVRGAGDPMALVGPVSAAITKLDPMIPIAKVRTMDKVLWEAVARPRFVTTLLAIFAIIALLLAAVGIYGVMSYSVAQRTHELGIRMALGARAGNVVRLVMGQGMALAGAGVAIGLAITAALNLALSKVLSGILYDVNGLDPTTFAEVAAVVAAVAALACWLPARRATRVDPIVALRRD